MPQRFRHSSHLRDILLDLFDQIAHNYKKRVSKLKNNVGITEKSPRTIEKTLIL
jgi:hypothetical protein